MPFVCRQTSHKNPRLGYWALAGPTWGQTQTSRSGIPGHPPSADQRHCHFRDLRKGFSLLGAVPSDRTPRRDRNETPPPKISAPGRGHCRAAGALADRKRASVSDASGYDDRSVCSRRGNRRCRSHRRRVPLAGAPATVRHRERGRGRRHHRHDPNDARQPRRLHHPGRPDGDACGRGGVLSEPRLPAGCRFRAGRHDRRPAGRDHGEKGFSRQRPQGVHQLCEGECRDGQRRACRRGLDHTHHGPAAAFAARRAADPGAVQRRRAGHDRFARRAGGLHQQCHPRRRFARSERHGQGLCHHHGRAQSEPAECPDHEGSRLARVRCIGLERPVCAQGDAAGGPRQARHCARRSARRCQRAQAPARPRLRHSRKIKARSATACCPGQE